MLVTINPLRSEDRALFLDKPMIRNCGSLKSSTMSMENRQTEGFIKESSINRFNTSRLEDSIL